MTPDRFSQIALSLPESLQIGPVNRPDFQVNGKIFASLFPDDQWGVVKVTPELQKELIVQEPDVFEACKGAWGHNGATIVLLPSAEEGSVLRALIDAWRKQAPSSLTDNFDESNL